MDKDSKPNGEGLDVEHAEIGPANARPPDPPDFPPVPPWQPAPLPPEQTTIGPNPFPDPIDPDPPPEHESDPTEEEGDPIEEVPVANAGDDGGAGCFAAGTLVATGDGGLIPIETINEGDLVVAREEASGKTDPRQVQRVWRHRARPTMEFEIEGGETVTATAVHRFFTQERGFVALGSIRVGDRLQTRTGGSVRLTKIRAQTKRRDVFNLTVQDHHTYFVGHAEVWVHNDKIDDPGSDDGVVVDA